MHIEQHLDDTIDLGAATLETRGQLKSGMEPDGGRPLATSAIADED